jgi:hypothetical protein
MSAVLQTRLSDLLQEVLARWAFLSSEPCAPQEGASLPVEYLAMLEANTVVLRCEAGAGAYFAEAFTGEPATEAAATDAVKELTNQLCGHLLSSYLMGVPKGFRRFIPVPSTHYAWPQSEPQDRCALRVEGFYLEVLVWAPAFTGGRS